MNHQDALPAGHRLRWYEISRLIGKGKFCHTYLATDHNLQRQVVIKEFFPADSCTRADDFSVVPSSARLAQIYSGLLDSFVAEARLLAQYHLENIVQVHNTLELNQTAYMVMTHEKGQSLATMLGENSVPLDQKMLHNIFLPVINGLSAIHKKGVIHGSISPDNIIIRPYGAPVLVDFGSSCVIASRLVSHRSQVVGNSYTPVEQLNPSTGLPGVVSDIYSIAASLYHAIARQPLCDAVERSNAIVSGRVDPFIPLVSTPSERFSTEFLSTVDEGLALKPRHRPESLAEWGESLRSTQAPQGYSIAPVVSNNALLPRVAGAESPCADNSFSSGGDRKPANGKRETSTTNLAENSSDAGNSGASPDDAVEEVIQAHTTVQPVESTCKKTRPADQRYALVAGLAVLVAAGVYSGLSIDKDTTGKEPNALAVEPDTRGSRTNAAEEPLLVAAEPVAPVRWLDVSGISVSAASVTSEPDTPVVAEVTADQKQIQEIVASAVSDPVGSSAANNHKPGVTATKEVGVKAPTELQAGVIEPAEAVASDLAQATTNNRAVKVMAAQSKVEAPSGTWQSLNELPENSPSGAKTDARKVNRIISSLNCGSLAASNNNPALKGMVTQSEIAWLDGGRSDLSALVDSQEVLVLDDVFCAPLSTFKVHANSRQVSLTTGKEHNRFKSGDRLVLNVAVNAFPHNYLYIDYFALDGSVLHMLSSQTTMDDEANQLMRGEGIVLGEPGDIERWDIAAPYGNELISILVTDAPLDIETGDEVEDAQSYLHRINRELASGEYQAVSSIVPILTSE